LKKSHLILNILTAFFLVLFLTACGKKGPPVPPGQKMPPAVNDLDKKISGSRLVLFWKIFDQKNKNFGKISGFIVYRAKDKTDGSLCSNCPLNFKQVADISLKQNTAIQTVTYTETLVNGYRYTYKVRAYTENKTLGKDSNTVQFIYKRQE